MKITQVKFILNTEKLNPRETKICQNFISYFPVQWSTDVLHLSLSLTHFLEAHKKFNCLFVVMDGHGSGGGGVSIVFVVWRKNSTSREGRVIFVYIDRLLRQA